MAPLSPPKDGGVGLLPPLALGVMVLGGVKLPVSLSARLLDAVVVVLFWIDPLVGTLLTPFHEPCSE